MCRSRNDSAMPDLATQGSSKLSSSLSEPLEQNRLPFLDGLRAVAVTLVILFHLRKDWFPSGFVGVDIFFVISGFVVARSFDRSWKQDKRHSYCKMIRFYVNRILRLWPALFVLVICSSLLYVMMTPLQWSSEGIRATAQSSLYAWSNVVLSRVNGDYFAPSAELNPFLHTWSLGIEEQFYAVFPVIAFLGYVFARRVPANRMFLSLSGFVIGISVFTASQPSRSQDSSVYYQSVSRVWELALGIFLYWCLESAGFRASAVRRAKLFSNFGLSLILLSASSGFGFRFPWPGSLFPAVGTFFVIAGFVSGKTCSPTKRIAESRLLVGIGRRSYSLYLWHWPIIVLFRVTIGTGGLRGVLMVFCIGFVSELSYRYLEQGFVLLKNRSVSFDHLVLFVAGSLLVVSIITVNKIYDWRSSLNLSVTKNSLVWSASGQPVEDDNFGLFSGKRLFVVGDSHAGAYAAMLQLLQDHDDLVVDLKMKPGCPLLNPNWPRAKWSEECRTFVDESMTFLKKEMKTGDALFLPGLLIPRLPQDWDVLDEESVVNDFLSETKDLDRQQALIESKVLFEAFADLDVHVLLEAPKPVFRVSQYQCADWFNRSNPSCKSGTRIERSLIEKIRQPIVEHFDLLTEHFQFVRVWDPVESLCDETTCLGTDGKTPIFSDADHLAFAGNLKTYPQFRDHLINVWVDSLGQVDEGLYEMSNKQLEGVSSSGLSAPIPEGRWLTDRQAEFQLILRAHFKPAEVEVNFASAVSSADDESLILKIGDKFTSTALREGGSSIRLPVRTTNGRELTFSLEFQTKSADFCTEGNCNKILIKSFGLVDDFP